MYPLIEISSEPAFVISNLNSVQDSMTKPLPWKPVSSMQVAFDKRRDLALLVSLLLVILLHPVLDHGMIGRVALMVLTFVPLVVATIKLGGKKGWLRLYVVLILGIAIGGIGHVVFFNKPLGVLEWASATVAFGLSVVGLFSYLQKARTVSADHLYTAASTYLLIGMSWFALYSTIEIANPGCFMQTTGTSTGRPADLLYFSLATLTTLGYGDIVPGTGGVRMLSALEAAAGVLYVAITVAQLVSAYKQGA
jgi:hypothetical protein